MRPQHLNAFLLVCFVSVASLLTGCNNDTPPSPAETLENVAPIEEAPILLPYDSLGEGSEPKNSGPFGGATPPEEAAQE